MVELVLISLAIATMLVRPGFANQPVSIGREAPVSLAISERLSKQEFADLMELWRGWCEADSRVKSAELMVYGRVLTPEEAMNALLPCLDQIRCESIETLSPILLPGRFGVYQLDPEVSRNPIVKPPYSFPSSERLRPRCLIRLEGVWNARNGNLDSTEAIRLHYQIHHGAKKIVPLYIDYVGFKLGAQPEGAGELSLLSFEEVRRILANSCGLEALEHLDARLDRESADGAEANGVLPYSEQDICDLRNLCVAVSKKSPDMDFALRRVCSGSMSVKELQNLCLEEICNSGLISHRVERYPRWCARKCQSVWPDMDKVSQLWASLASKSRKDANELVMLHQKIHEAASRLAKKFLCYSRWNDGVRPRSFVNAGEEESRAEVRACLVELCGEDAIAALDKKLDAR
ncbi:MAG: hypothetical protein AB7M93_01710 [Candidatus Obscuribacterales bacterium]